MLFEDLLAQTSSLAQSLDLHCGKPFQKMMSHAFFSRQKSRKRFYVIQ